MQRFHFHILIDDQIVEDEEGIVLPGLSDALAEAEHGIEELHQDGGWRGNEKAVIQITHESGMVLTSVPIPAR